MAYEKYTWETGELITAEKLNRNEEQLSDITEEVENARGGYQDLNEHIEAIDRNNSQATNDINELFENFGNIEKNIASFQPVINNAIVSGSVENSTGYFYNSDGNVVFTMTGLGGGGGGGGGTTSSSIVTLNNNTGWASTIIASEMDVNLELNWNSVDEKGEETPGTGSLQVSVNGIIKLMQQIPQGDFTVTISKDWLNFGSNRISIMVTDIEGASKSRSFLITVEQLIIESTFNQNIIQRGIVTFSYVPTGAGTKTIHFEVDGNELSPESTSTSGRQLNKTIPAQTHGAHKLRVWFEVEFGEEVVKSNELLYSVIWVEANNNTPIISSTFNTTTASQYSTVTIPFMVYTPNSEISTVIITNNDSQISELRVPPEMTNIQVRLNEAGINNIVIRTGDEFIEFTIDVEEAEEEIIIEKENLDLELTCIGKNNTEENRARWDYKKNDETTISANLQGFNFISNGWMQTTELEPFLRVNSGARVYIPYRLFEDRSFMTQGRTIEIDFAVRDVINYDTIAISCIDNDGTGLKITPAYASFRAKISEISTQFKDEERFRLSFVCEKRGENNSNIHPLLLTYINAIPSGAVEYSFLDDFYFENPYITIGSDDCTVDIYSIRIYKNDLTRFQILNNWIADTWSLEEKLARYSRNNIINKNISNEDGTATIDIDKLPANLPYMILECPELPQYKGDKKTITGYYTDPANLSKSFTFEGCELDVQGTTSAQYLRKNYDMKFKGGFTLKKSKEHIDNYILVPGVKPFNRFVLKADVASSEGANNVELVKLYCDLCPYKTREMEQDEEIRQGIYGIPIVVFWQNTKEQNTPITFLGKYNFNLPKRAAGPYGYAADPEDPKKKAKLESWEFQNNLRPLMLFKTDIFNEEEKPDPDNNDKPKADWLFDFEARFPNSDYKNNRQLKRFVEFVHSTDRTEEGLSDDDKRNRLIKFKNEFPNYAELDSFIFYYVFTEFFLMTDSRAKNLFIGFTGGDIEGTENINPDGEPEDGWPADRKAVAEPYDMDTALGIDNLGTLTFGPSLEDSDHLPGNRLIFNAQDSILWNNIRDAYPIEISTMYGNMRINSLFNYNAIEKRFEDHQNIWPEVIWQEDSWYKYILPVKTSIIQGDSEAQEKQLKKNADYLTMLLGNKIQQRKRWLRNRFYYMDSKWSAGSAPNEQIQFRGYAGQVGEEFSLSAIPSSDLYVTIKVGNDIIKGRSQNGDPVTFRFTLKDNAGVNVNEGEIYIYSGSQIAEISDLSSFMIGKNDFGPATRLKALKIGSNQDGYINERTNEISVSKTYCLLKRIDARNCIAFNGAIQLEGCVLLQEAYFDGSNVAGIVLPNTNTLRTLHLPNTIRNLTIKNQTKITDFECEGYNNIDIVSLSNVSYDVALEILSNIKLNIQVSLRDINWECTYEQIKNIYDLVDNMYEVSNSIVQPVSITGNVLISNLTGTQYNSLMSRQPNVTITYNNLISYVYFWDPFGKRKALSNSPYQVNNGGSIARVPPPNITPTNSNRFTFDPNKFLGWSKIPFTDDGDIPEVDPDALKNVIGDRNVYAVYDYDVTTHNIKFALRGRDTADGNDQILQTIESLPYGTSVEDYEGSINIDNESVKSVLGDEYVFEGEWEEPLAKVTEDKTYYAVFKDNSNLLVRYLKRNLTSFEGTSDFDLTTIGPYAFYKMNTLKEFSTSATSIDSYAFVDCDKLNKVQLTNVNASVSISGPAFSGCNKLTYLLIYSPFQVNLPLQAFRYTKIAGGLGGIFVQTDLLDSYKNSNIFKRLPNIFGFNINHPDEVFNKTNFETITDDWNTIINNIDSNLYTKYRIGDTKMLTLDDGTQIYMQLAAIEKDTKVDGSKAKTTWLSRTIYPVAQRITTNDIASWENSSLRNWLNTTLFSKIPELIRNNIKQVIKSSYDATTATETSTEDSIWIPSSKEVLVAGGTWGGKNIKLEEQSEAYDELFTFSPTNSTQDERMIYDFDGTSQSWPLRTSVTPSSFVMINNQGYVSSISVSSTAQIRFGFCMG